MSAPEPADWRHDTVTSFPAIRDDTPPPADGKCKCGMPGCPDNPGTPADPGTSVTLSCAEGVTSRIWRTRVTEGTWPDIPKIADDGHARIHLPALAANRRIRSDVAAGRQDIAAVLRADPERLGDVNLNYDLGWLAAELAAQLADLEAMGYRAWVGAHPASLVRAEAAARGEAA